MQHKQTIKTKNKILRQPTGCFFIQSRNSSGNGRKENIMSFEAITTQEDFEARLKERLEQKERSVRSQLECESKAEVEKLKKLNEEYKEKLNVANAQINELTGKVKEQNDYEETINNFKLRELKTKAALAQGLPYSLVDRIQGEDEESIENDVKTLAEYFTANHASKIPPLKDNEPEKTGEDSAYMALVKDL